MYLRLMILKGPDVQHRRGLLLVAYSVIVGHRLSDAKPRWAS